MQCLVNVAALSIKEQSLHRKLAGGENWNRMIALCTGLVFEAQASAEAP